MTLDTVLVVVVAVFALVGFTTGLIQAVGSIVGMAIGSIIAARTFRSVGGFTLPLLGNNELVAAITSFILVFGVTTKLIGLLFHLVDKAYRLAAIIPGLKGFNRLGGLVLGAIEGVLFTGIILSVATKLPLSEQMLATIHNGAVSRFFLAVSGWVIPLLPGLYERARSVTGGL